MLRSSLCEPFGLPAALQSVRSKTERKRRQLKFDRVATEEVNRWLPVDAIFVEELARDRQGAAREQLTRFLAPRDLPRAGSPLRSPSAVRTRSWDDLPAAHEFLGL
jgi:hypothetical protein